MALTIPEVSGIFALFLTTLGLALAAVKLLLDAKLSMIATDVAYLAGRQAERDRH